jgi:hypothetical protein
MRAFVSGLVAIYSYNIRIPEKKKHGKMENRPISKGWFTAREGGTTQSVQSGKIVYKMAGEIVYSFQIK